MDFRLEGGAMHDVDQALIIRRALGITGEIAQIARGREDARDAPGRRDPVRIGDTIQRLNHQNQNEVFIDGLAIQVVGKPRPLGRADAAAAALAKRWIQRPIGRPLRLFRRADGRDRHPQGAAIQRLLLFALILVGDARAGHGVGIGTSGPHIGDIHPGAGRMLHLGPDKVVFRPVGGGTIGFRRRRT